ncbi:MAG: hypothetical protein U5Q03_14880 [Bacteroidota bacterium]|nr:hypothetical protein [Bacteroidota bacterium]
MAEKAGHPDERVREACGMLAQRRKESRLYPFADAFTAAHRWGEIHELGQ